jgi:hypothetical protein
MELVFWFRDPLKADPIILGVGLRRGMVSFSAIIPEGSVKVGERQRTDENAGVYEPPSSGVLASWVAPLWWKGHIK